MYYEINDRFDEEDQYAGLDTFGFAKESIREQSVLLGPSLPFVAWKEKEIIVPDHIVVRFAGVKEIT